MRDPLCIDLCCGLGGWTKGFLAEGYDVIGFDIERHAGYPGQLVLQDIRTLHGLQLRGATVIVASPPCTDYAKWGMRMFYPNPPVPDLSVWEAAVRIAKQAGTPLVIENVVGAQHWHGKSLWHSGSFHLWGDLPALLPAHGWRKHFGCGIDPEGRREIKGGRRFSSRSPQRKLHSMQMAEIPFDLAQWIAKCFKP